MKQNTFPEFDWGSKMSPDDIEDEIALDPDPAQKVAFPDGKLGLAINLHGAPTSLLELYTVNPQASPRLLNLVNQPLAEHPYDTIVVVIHRYKPETIHGRPI